MKSLRRVVWSEGMLMSPHHLQLSDAYHEQLAAVSLQSAVPVSWGLSELALSTEALSSGTVSLKRVKGVMPSGLPIQFASSDAGCPVERTVSACFPANRESLEVFLGLPRAREGAANVSDDLAGRSRYYMSSEECFDFTGGGNEQSVSLSRPRMSLLFGGEGRDDYECMKIAEVIRASAGGFEVSSSFVPPCLRIGASNVLAERLERLLAAMAEKAREVRGQLSVRGQVSVEYGSADITRFLLLDALNGALPWVRHMREVGDASARELYLGLAQIAGRLCSFVQDADPLDLLPYRHDDATASFERLFVRIAELLRGSVASRHVAVPLKGRSDGVHFGELTDSVLMGVGVRFVLGVECGLRKTDVESTVANLGKLGSWGDIQRLVSAATVGIPLTPGHVPAEIPLRPGHVYFLVGTSNRYWESVMRERKVALYLPPPLQGEDVKVTLYGIP